MPTVRFERVPLGEGYDLPPNSLYHAVEVNGDSVVIAVEQEPNETDQRRGVA